MFSLKPSYPALLAVVVLLVYAQPALAFGAGNIASMSKVEGQNWRHGDIEDTLLTLFMARVAGGKKFDKLAVSRVYFGNWLRDYSQAIDVGTVKSVSAEAIRLLLSILGFLTFGYGSKEFEVTADRLGTYRPEDHIDNPKGYPGTPGVDARQYDRRLRGPVDERVELAIDPRTGMKNYIANESAGCMTTALHIRRLFSRCIELGRRSRNKDDLYEALRLLGTGLHACEDFLAHSNYIELALIEMGERDVFPHVGSRTAMRLEGARGDVYPCITGTFGGVDFLHSVTGEVSDKLTQNELDELEGTLQGNSRNDNSIIESLLDKIPDGVFGGGDKKGKMSEINENAANTQMQATSISPREPEEYTRYIQQVFRSIMPAIEFHDDLMKSISEAIEKIPILPQLIEQLEDQLSVWVFSIMAPLVVPVLQQVKNELRTGSTEIIQSSKSEQLIVFNDDRSTDPTHSMLSKDHFSNILNEAAGKTASKVVGWVVPQIMQAWDDQSVDIDRTMNRIIHGVLHHPAQRNMGEDGARDCRELMFETVKEWWSQQDRRDYLNKLSRQGVENGENHKEGVHDTGHGSCGKLGIKKNFAGGGTFEDKIAASAATAIYGGITGGISNFVGSETGIQLPGSSGGHQTSFSGFGGGRQEGGLGGFLSSVGGSLLGGFQQNETQSFEGRRAGNDSYTETRTEYGHSGNRYGQAEVQQTRYNDGGESDTYRRYEQDENGRGNTRYGVEEERVETRPSRQGGWEERTERRFESNETSYEESTDWHRGDGRRGGRDENEYREESFGGGQQQQNPWGEQREERFEGRQEGGWGGGEERRNDDYGGGAADDIVEGVLGEVGRAFGNFGGGRRDEEGEGERRSGWGF